MRTKRQEALLESDAAWKWFLLGYEAGIRDGHGAGAQEIVDQIKAAGAELLPAARGLMGLAEARAARAEMLAATTEVDNAAERHARCAESWGLPVDGAA